MISQVVLLMPLKSKTTNSTLAHLCFQDFNLEVSRRIPLHKYLCLSCTTLCLCDERYVSVVLFDFFMLDRFWMHWESQFHVPSMTHGWFMYLKGNFFHALVLQNFSRYLFHYISPKSCNGELVHFSAWLHIAVMFIYSI